MAKNMPMTTIRTLARKALRDLDPHVGAKRFGEPLYLHSYGEGHQFIAHVSYYDGMSIKNLELTDENYPIENLLLEGCYVATFVITVYDEDWVEMRPVGA